MTTTLFVLRSESVTPEFTHDHTTSTVHGVYPSLRDAQQMAASCWQAIGKTNADADTVEWNPADHDGQMCSRPLDDDGAELGFFIEPFVLGAAAWSVHGAKT